MKINKPVQIGISNPYQQQQKTAKSEKQNQSPRSRDQVQISNEAKAMLEQKLDSSSKGVSQQERLAKIEEIKLRIEQGKYEVEPQAIADKISKFWFNQ